ncbi:unnamed protein product [Haemonchus placei]|uniref:RAB3GAP2_C domain-containing protein n=1 Tax=Haemonchus placei TaxID=6290 RepID=A0A0N4VST1_HAEPC|nr:unnamed protein product [Haemonchus placei]
MSNGHVVFFTERGWYAFLSFVFRENFVLSHFQFKESQQFTVVTSVDFFAVDPVSLHSTLLKAKSAIAKGEKTAEELSKTLEVDVDRLKPENGYISASEKIVSGMCCSLECIISLPLSINNFLFRYFSLPAYYTYMYTSDKVFSTFAWTTDSDKKKIWQEAIKYGKSFVPHFGFRDMLGFSSTPKKKAAVSQTSHAVTTRGTLDDSRLAVETALEASRGLVAVVDHIARIVLIDIVNRQIIRIWKGYRDATVAWINSSNNEQTALFLAIFAPRRALLEVWNVQVIHLLIYFLRIVYESKLSLSFFRLVVPFHLSMIRVTSQDQHDQLLLSKVLDFIYIMIEGRQFLNSSIQFSSSPDLDLFMEVYSMLPLIQVGSLVATEKWSPNQLEEKLKSIDCLNELQSLLPNSLKQSLLCCDIAWELMSQWFKDTLQCFDNFELALGYLALVDDSRLRHGVLVLMWQNFILERFKAVVLLIEKTGRAPKEREARQQLQMPEIRVEFLSRCHELLKMLMDDVRDSPPPSHIQQDQLIEIAQSHPPASLQIAGTSRDSLVELAIRQQLVNYHLVLHHYHLAVAAAIQLSAGLRNHILRVLFCPIGQRAFFLPLDSHPLIPLDRVDDAVVERRHQFLTKVAEQGTDIDRKLARFLSFEWNLTVDTIQITVSILFFLLRGPFVPLACLSHEISNLDSGILVSVGIYLILMFSFLNTLAGDEKMRVDWPTPNWIEAVQSFGRIVAGLSLQPQFVVPFVRIGGITAQYWGIHIID